MAKNISLGRAVLVLSTEIGDFLSDLDDAGAHAGKLQKAVEGMGDSLKSFGKGTTELGKSLTMSVTGPIVAVIGSLAALALSTAKAGDTIGEIAVEAGVSAERWQEYAFALGRVARVSEDQLVKGFSALTDAIGQASAGSEKHTGLLNALGFTQNEIKSGAIGTEEAFERLRGALQRAESPAQALAFAGDLLGQKVGQKLAGAIRESNTEIDTAIEQHRELGLGMSGPALKAASDFQDQIELVTGEFTALGREIGAEVMPIITEQLIPFLRDSGIPIIKRVSEVIAAAVSWFGNLPAPVQGAIAVVVGLAAAIGPVLVVVGTLITSIGTIVSAFGVLAPVVTGAGALIAAIGAGPLTLIVGAIAGVVLAWRNWDTITAILGSVWAFVSDVVMNKIVPILSIGGPFLSPVAAVVAIWKNWDAITTVVRNVYLAVKEWLVDKLSGIFDAVKGKIDAVTGFFKDMYEKVVGNSTVPAMVDGIGAHFKRLDAEMVAKANAATEKTKEAFKKLQEKMREYYNWLGERELEVVALAQEALQKREADIRTFYNWLGERRMEDLAHERDVIIQKEASVREYYNWLGERRMEDDARAHHSSQRQWNTMSGFFTNMKDAFGGSTGTIKEWLGGVGGMFQAAFTGGGGALGAVKSFATKGLETVMGMIPFVGPFISKFAGPIIAGFGKIHGAIKSLFGGPNADELSGREIVDKFEKNLSKMLTDTQRLETGNESWKNTIVALRDKYREMGLSEAEALKDAERLWASSKQGAAESKRVIEEIMKKLEGGFTVPVNFDVGPLDIPGLPDVPVMPMAAGGFGHVTRPTLFLAGEGGAEDFAFSGGGKRFSAGGGGTTVIFEIDRRVMAEWLVPELPGAKVRLGIGR